MDITNLMLLTRFRQCAHIQFHRPRQFRGQWRILVLLKERGLLTQRELTQILQRKPATLSEQLENMEKAGWITREKFEADKRNVVIRLTQLGTEMAQEAEHERQKEADDLFDGLNQEDRNRLFEILGKLGDAWSAGNCGEEGDSPL